MQDSGNNIIRPYLLLNKTLLLLNYTILMIEM